VDDGTRLCLLAGSLCRVKGSIGGLLCLCGTILRERGVGLWEAELWTDRVNGMDGWMDGWLGVIDCFLALLFFVSYTQSFFLCVLPWFRVCCCACLPSLRYLLRSIDDGPWCDAIFDG
jgi:hypothetical protein